MHVHSFCQIQFKINLRVKIQFSADYSWFDMRQKWNPIVQDQRFGL